MLALSSNPGSQEAKLLLLGDLGITSQVVLDVSSRVLASQTKAGYDGQDTGNAGSDAT
tara:strand:+ start:2801 stop:2974 length:174 start_codon:yes stop_codon:yes gene_type:complete